MIRAGTQPSAKADIPTAGRTALFRPGLSRPVSLALADRVLTPQLSFFDYGCGRGGDIARLSAIGIDSSGWDPIHLPSSPKQGADVVNLGYVVNVIEDEQERCRTLEDAWRLAKRVLVVAARLDWDINPELARPHRDGVLTSRGTFQKFFTHDEFRAWVQSTLGLQAVSAAPGILYVFRNAADEQAALAARYRGRTQIRDFSPALFEANRDVLEPLADFVLDRGRLPGDEELSCSAEICRRFGSLVSAFSLVRRIVGDDRWEEAVLNRQRDFLVYLSLSAFGKRPKFGQLPEELQLDIRAFFGTYHAACDLADRLLYSAGDLKAVSLACEQSTVGKLTREALYVHASAINRLSHLLRVYEGCARQLLGSIEGVMVVKLNRLRPRVSYLNYPGFDRDPHPTLHESFVVDLPKLATYHRDYRTFANPPILHRKETLVAADYPLRAKFERLTADEVRLGVLADTSVIGTRDGWTQALARNGVAIRGHRAVKLASQQLTDKRSDSVRT